jgi:hypothetical protein
VIGRAQTLGEKRAAEAQLASAREEKTAQDKDDAEAMQTTVASTSAFSSSIDRQA